MPRSIDRILGQTAIPDTITDDVLDDLKQEIVRDVTAVLMFGGQPAPQGQHPTRLDCADRYLTALSCDLLRSDHAAEHLAGIADDPVDIDGALHFGCLLNLATKPEGAQWWWQYAAGAGNATAAYCLHLLHLRRGDLRDAEHWMSQALALDIDINFARRPKQRNWLHTPYEQVLREAVARLKVEDACGEFHHPDQRLADQIEELADAC
ncbi:hypothetical protein ACIQB5_48715 [Streptomyces sp. NPDC088560]|uniref:hypothetical protein n=1 Tax=Streptomyces sp. NPDC088560 TaxID=3365868 RepID=UPI0038256782